MAIIDKIQLSGTVYTIGNETTTAVTSASTDNEIPTAKAVYDAIPQGGGSSYTGVSGITINENNEIYYNGFVKTWLTDNHEDRYAVYWFQGMEGKIWINGNSPKGRMSNLRSQFSCGLNQLNMSIDGFALGNNNSIYGFNAGGLCNGNTVNGNYSLGVNYQNKTNNSSEFASGQYNNSVSASTTFGDSGNTLFSVGNGTSNNARHNAFEIRQNGDIYISKDGQDVKLQDQLGGGGGSITIDPSLDSGSTNAVANSAITNAINSKMDEVNFASFYGNQYYAGLKGYYYDSQTETQTEKFNWGMVWQSDGSIGFDALGNLAVFNKIDTSAITTSVTSSSTDSQVPSAKAVYDQLDGLKLKKITQSEYDALSPNYDANTLYVING